MPKEMRKHWQISPRNQRRAQLIAALKTAREYVAPHPSWESERLRVAALRAIEDALANATPES